MPVDAELQPVLDLLAAMEQPPPMEAGPDAAREGFALLCAAFGPGAQDVTATDITLAGADGPIPGRIHRPAGAAPSATGAAGLVFLHGGGFVIGSLDTHDALCRDLAAGADITVVSVDYRLAPEHPAPAAAADAASALDDVVRRAPELGLDPSRLAVGGDSAGGNLAAVTAVAWRDRQRDDPGLSPLCLQVLIYPAVELADEDRFPSMKENAEGYLLTAETMAFFRHHYLTGATVDAADPMVSPLRTADLAGVAPALVLTAEYDPLRDEGEAYAAALAAAGVDVELDRVEGAIHAFVQMGSTEIGRQAVKRICAALRTALS